MPGTPVYATAPFGSSSSLARLMSSSSQNGPAALWNDCFGSASQAVLLVQENDSADGSVTWVDRSRSVYWISCMKITSQQSTVSGVQGHDWDCRGQFGSGSLLHWGAGCSRYLWGNWPLPNKHAIKRFKPVNSFGWMQTSLLYFHWSLLSTSPLVMVVTILSKLLLLLAAWQFPC